MTSRRGKRSYWAPHVGAPVSSSPGEYFASIIIPLDANLGKYRVRWTFREVVGGPIQQALMEFDVIDKTQAEPVYEFTPHEHDLVKRLRTLLRDNCVGEEETVELDVGGENMVVTIRDLYEALHGAR